MFTCKLINSEDNPVYKRTCVAPLDAGLDQTYLALPCRDIRELLNQFIPRTPPPLDLTQPISALYLCGSAALTACISPSDLLYVGTHLGLDVPIRVLSSRGVLQRTFHLYPYVTPYLMSVSKQGDLFVCDYQHIKRFNSSGIFESDIHRSRLGMIGSMVLNPAGTRLFFCEGNAQISVIDIEETPYELASIDTTYPASRLNLLSDGAFAIYSYPLNIIVRTHSGLVWKLDACRSLHVLDGDQILVLNDKNTLRHFDQRLQEINQQKLPLQNLYWVDRFADGRLLLLGH